METLWLDKQLVYYVIYVTTVIIFVTRLHAGYVQLHILTNIMDPSHIITHALLTGAATCRIEDKTPIFILSVQPMLFCNSVFFIFIFFSLALHIIN